MTFSSSVGFSFMFLFLSLCSLSFFSFSIQSSFWSLKMGQPRPLFHLFSSFQTTNFIKNRYVKKRPSSLWYRDSNSRPSEHESPIITTRPGLPPCFYSLYLSGSLFFFLHLCLSPSIWASWLPQLKLLTDLGFFHSQIHKTWILVFLRLNFAFCFTRIKAI